MQYFDTHAVDIELLAEESLDDIIGGGTVCP
jgi:hypothetical protein